MAITMQEKPDSRTWTTGQRRRCELRYGLEGTSDDLVVRDHVEANSYLFYNYCLRTDISIEPEAVDDPYRYYRW